MGQSSNLIHRHHDKSMASHFQIEAWRVKSISRATGSPVKESITTIRNAYARARRGE